MFDEIYEVTRDDYKNFIPTIKPEAREIKEEQIDEYHAATVVYSKSSGKKLCARVYMTVDNDETREHEPEKYYILELPEADEYEPPVGKHQVILTSREQVQQLLNFITKENKKND